MTSTNDESWLQKTEITDLINRYCAALDQQHFDSTMMQRIFADDARIVRPNGGEMIGPQAIGDSHRQSFLRFRATQHLTSGLVVTLDDQAHAAFRGNLVALHFWAEGLGDTTVDLSDNYFLAGGVLTGNAATTIHGWRITHVANTVIWRKGTGFQQILQTH